MVGDALDRARQLATVDAAGRQRINEGVDRQRVAGDLDVLGRLARGDERMGRMRIESIRPSPLLGALSQVLQGAGAGIAMRPGRAAPAGFRAPGRLAPEGVDWLNWRRGIARPVPLDPWFGVR